MFYLDIMLCGYGILIYSERYNICQFSNTFQNNNIYSCFLDVLVVARVCMVWDLQTRHTKKIIFIWK